MKQNFTPVTLWCMCVLFTNIIQAQVPTLADLKSAPYFSISAGVVQSASTADPTTYQSFTYRSLVAPGTTKELYIRSNATYRIKHTFANQVSGFAESNIYFPLHQQWSLRTGIGLQLDQFSYENSSELIDIGVPIDTVPISINDNNNIVRYEYEPGFTFDIPRDIKYKLLYLRVPILVEYHTPFNISLTTGIFIQSLLWSEASRYETKSRVETEKLPDGKTLTTYYLSTGINKKNPAPNVANATIGWQFGANYRLNRFALEAAYGQTFLNTFTNTEGVLYDYQNYNAKVTNRYVRIGIHYFLQ